MPQASPWRSDTFPPEELPLATPELVPEEPPLVPPLLLLAVDPAPD